MLLITQSAGLFYGSKLIQPSKMNLSWDHFFLPAWPPSAAILWLKKAANEISPPEARPSRCSLLPETVAGGTGHSGSPPFTLAVVALQPATPFCSISFWRTRSRFHTCCLLSFPPELAARIQGLALASQQLRSSHFCFESHRPGSCKDDYLFGGTSPKRADGKDAKSQEKA